MGEISMARYRGLRAIAGMARVKVRRSIDLRELSDFGAITASGSDLPTAGATHRASTGGSTGATRGYTNLGEITGVKVDTQDFGSITTTASSDLGYNDETYGY
jgi:hypothetical protein|tara:strand:+ start:210 stop:518 length:309 start_codon:yes stop_codon:yes gene_type:complete